jgi:hypothetical protein
LKTVISEKRDCVVIGNVQSGKTKFIIDLVKNIKEQVIILTRDHLADLIQLKQRMPKFKEESNIFITMMNCYRINKLVSLIENKKCGKFLLIIDESDMVFKTPVLKEGAWLETKFAESFKKLKKYIHKTIYISATNITALFKIKDKKIVYLKPPHNYIGIDKVNINDEYSIKEQLEPYNTIFQKEKSFVLHKSEHRKEKQVIIANKISAVNKKCICCVLNCEGYTLIKNQKIVKIESKNTPLNKMISNLTSEYKHVVFIAGHIASRGLSFVSEDFSIHLSDEVMFPSLRSRGDTIVQGLRLLGVFKDTKYPTLYTDKSTYSEILAYIKLQKSLYKKAEYIYSDEDITCNIRYSDNLPRRRPLYNNTEKVLYEQLNNSFIGMKIKNDFSTFYNRED